MTSDLLIALYVGLSAPVIGAGVALDLGASAPNTVLGFAILVGLGRRRLGLGTAAAPVLRRGGVAAADRRNASDMEGGRAVDGARLFVGYARWNRG
jgi:hypothetical protein